MAAGDSRLRGLRRSLLAEDLGEAARLRQQLVGADLTGADRWHLELLAAEYAALDGDFEAAEQRLIRAEASRLEGAWQAKLIHARAHVRMAEGQGAAAIQILETTPDAERNQDWHDLYWKALLASPKATLKESAQGRLVRDVVTAGTLQEQQQLLRESLGAPDSALNEASLPSSLRAILGHPNAPVRVGLVIPLAGPLQAFGSAFLEGFTSAWFDVGDNAQVSFTVYDANELETDADYSRLASQLIGDRIQAVFGPVSRSKLASMRRALPKDIGWVALNRLQHPAMLREGQFAFQLSTEDEIEALAKRMRTLDAARVLAYHAPAGWSLRAADTLQAELGDERLIGRVQLSDAAAVTEEVGLSLLIDGSEARIRSIRRLLRGAVETKARRRQDLDAVVLLVDGNLASAVGPALRFHDAGDVPIFTISRMIREVPANEYGVLEGAAFLDLPWNLDESNLKRRLHAEFGQVAPLIETFRAIGVDCFRLADRFELLVAMQTEGLLDVLEGASGTLRTSGTQIARRLVWSEVRSGGIRSLE